MKFGADPAAPASVPGYIGAQVCLAAFDNVPGNTFINRHSLTDETAGAWSATGTEDKVSSVAKEYRTGGRPRQAEDDPEVIGKERVNLGRADHLPLEKPLLHFLEEDKFFERLQLGAKSVHTGSCCSRCLFCDFFSRRAHPSP